MTLRFYFDQHMPRAIADGLRLRGVDVVRTQDDGTEEWRDEEIFARAADLGRIMVTQDSDYIEIATRWLIEGRSFPGLVKATDPRRDIGRAIQDLQLIAQASSADEVRDQILYIPL